MARKRTRKTVIHVDQHIIKANTKNGTDNPPLTVREYDHVDKAHEVIILDSAGVEIGRFVYRPHQPLSCGARVWFETTSDRVTLFTREEVPNVPVRLDAAV